MKGNRQTPNWCGNPHLGYTIRTSFVCTLRILCFNLGVTGNKSKGSSIDFTITLITLKNPNHKTNAHTQDKDITTIVQEKHYGWVHKRHSKKVLPINNKQ